MNVILCLLGVFLSRKDQLIVFSKIPIPTQLLGMYVETHLNGPNSEMRAFRGEKYFLQDDAEAIEPLIQQGLKKRLRTTLLY